jgi:hypothetical protein
MSDGFSSSTTWRQLLRGSRKTPHTLCTSLVVAACIPLYILIYVSGA